MKMNLMPAFKFRFTDSLRSLLAYFAIIVAIFVLFVTLFSARVGEGGESTLSAFGVSSAIAMFVVGICTVREHLRLCLQMGVSRRTAFVSEALSTVLVCLCLAAAGELLMLGAQAVTAGRENIHIFDLYQILYVGMDAKTLSFSQHIGSLLLSASLFLSGYTVGAFISLVLYRLPKAWRVIVCVGVPALLLIVFPVAISETGLGDAFSAAVISFMEWVGKSPANFIAAFTGISVIAAALNWLLMRKAPVTAAVG